MTVATMTRMIWLSTYYSYSSDKNEGQRSGGHDQEVVPVRKVGALSVSVSHVNR